MITLGLDIGNGFVKAVSHDKQIKFPSLISHRTSSEWNEQKKGIGDMAAAEAGRYNTTVISPVVSGKQVDRQGYMELLKEAFRLLKIDMSTEEMYICAGLPAGRVKEKPQIEAALKAAIPNIKRHWIVPQAFGTAVHMKLQDAIVINIGHGTTEYQVVEGGKPSVGHSDSMAAGILIHDKTNAQYIHPDVFSTLEAKREIPRLVSYVKNQYEKLRARSPNEYPLVLAGGGILIPGMQEEIKKQFKIKELSIPEEPAFSNAIGMFRHAQKNTGRKENTSNPTEVLPKGQHP